MRYQPDSWVKRAMSAMGLLLLIAVGAHVVWSLLAPLVPALVVIPMLLAIYVFVFRRR